MFVNKLALGVVLVAVTALVATGAIEFGQQVLKSAPAATGMSDGNGRDLEIKRGKLEAAKAELEAFTAAKDEALNRLEGMKKANERIRGTYADDDVREAVLTYRCCVNGETAMRATIELTQLELSPASARLDIMRQKVAVAKAELELSTAAKDAARNRVDSMIKPQWRGPGTFSVEDVRRAKTTYEDSVKEEVEKRAAYEQAQRELEAFNGI